MGSFSEAPSTTWQHSPPPTGKQDGRVHYSARPPAISQPGFRKQEGGRLGCCFDVAVSQNEPGAKQSGIQEWHSAALGAGSAACALASWQFGHLSGNQTAKWKIITLFTSERTAHMGFFNNKSIFSSPVVPIERGRCGPPVKTKAQFSSARHLCLGTGTSVLLGWGQVLPSSSQHLHPKILPSLLLRRTPDREKEELLNNLQP